jgi:hypothetical protein
MLTTITPREVVTSGTLETNTFSIAANGKAFKVLIDGLYSDKIKAVIRELWTNAYDSHREAGNPGTAFSCHLPTTWEPYFSVRDYGVSLSHNDLMTLYTTVFHSSKENTNEQVGKLGLGSKSPFAYTDTFTVSAWRNGQKRVYSAYIGADHIPRISLMTEEDTDEPTGLEVSFPVKDRDYYAFRQKAEILIKGFDPRPEVPGLSVKEEKVLFSGAGWKLVEGYGLDAQAKQGCVLYPIDPDAVIGASDAQRSLLNAGLLIDFPIGELEITANRESLGYDAPTCANIIARLSTIEAELLAQITEMLADCTTLWEARTKVNMLKHSSIPECAHKLLKDLRWRGKELKEQIYFTLDPRDVGAVQIESYDSSYFTTRRNKDRYKSLTRSAHIDPTNTTIIWHDTSRPVTRAEARLAHAYAQNRFRTRGRFMVVKGAANSKALQRTLVRMGRPLVTLCLNDFDLPPQVKNVVKRKVRAKLLDGTTSRNMTEVDVVVDGSPVYYIAAQRADVLAEDGAPTARTFYDVYTIFKEAKACGIIPQGAQGYIIPASLKHTVKGDTFINILTLANDHVAKNFDKQAAGAYLTLQAIMERGGKWRTLVDTISAHKINVASSTSPFSKAIATALSAITAYNQEKAIMRPLIDLAMTVINYVPARTPTAASFEMPDECVTRYPMLVRLLNATSEHNINDDFAEAAIDYVNLVDSLYLFDVQTANEIDIAA